MGLFYRGAYFVFAEGRKLIAGRCPLQIDRPIPLSDNAAFKESAWTQEAGRKNGSKREKTGF
jgi:hypothetical protein